MYRFVKTLLRKVELQCAICRQILDATLEQNEVLIEKLNVDFKRLSDEIEEYLESARHIDFTVAMEILQKEGEDLLGRPSYIPYCASEVIHHFALRRELGEEAYVRSCSLREETNWIEYTMELEKYAELEGHEKNIMFELIAMTIYGSQAFLEAFKGNYERSEELFVPGNFIDEAELNDCLTIYLTQYAANHYYALETLFELKEGKGFVEDFEAFQIVMDNYDLSLLDEKIAIAAIYATARQRDLDISLPDITFRNRETIDMIGEAAEMGEKYLKTHCNQYEKIRIDRKDTSED